MAYNDDSVLARLSSLNESHDSIATAAQWIMFHRRHADRTVQLWMQRLKDSSSTKRLSLIYLANEVVQQSRIRHKEDFVIAFSPVVAEASATAYKGAPAEIQAKLRRVIDVWKDRSIFEAPIQEAIHARLDEIDKARGVPLSGFGVSPFKGASVPPEFAPLVTAHQKIVKLNRTSQTTVSSAIQEYDSQVDPEAPVPSAPVYAARLNGLLKTLVNADNAVAECVKAREALVAGLEKMLEVHRSALVNEKKTSEDILERKTKIENQKQEVETAIMRALGPPESNGAMAGSDSGSPHPEPDRPEMEALTPPPLQDDSAAGPSEGLDVADAVSAPGNNMDMSQEHAQPHRAMPESANGPNKRRRIDDTGDFIDLGGDDGIEPEVAEMLQDSPSV
ncbi:uncharacterized protein UV8b_06438 [Ustilaginoidea virens]|uniref:CID domain-containing protein n=1 Tax=Ustilaginoidea virens TaxID=1159556 RepID=A0A063CBX1_USTVR|nr:uncharacterized protein UV8b_06438 [Ustilaginoidea virens]QUC22197.1 hypothetical protein UV8b_06438 [Ustilaginoidea virens]GAO19716.1 hypothetical protein UVI_02038600 [Ustilaginoidea virens]